MLKGHSLLTVGFLWVLLLICQGEENVSGHGDGEGERIVSSSSASYGGIAYGASDYTRRNFLTSFGDYRVSNKGWESQWVYCWPTFAQVYADVGMLELSLLNQTSTSVTLDDNDNDNDILLFENYILSSLDWMEKVLWKPKSMSGGFFAAAFVNEGYVDTSLQYVDDNAFAGVVYMECVRVTNLSISSSSSTPQQVLNERCLAGGLRIANWLINGGAWDSVLGGGFWWNTDKPFKPTNANALAALFFSRLYNLTKNETYLQWSSKTLSWLESTLYTPSNGLFAWYISLNTTTSTLGGGEEAKEGIGGHVNTTYFAYDNAIMTLVYQQQFGGGTPHSSTTTDTWSLVSAILKQFWISSSGAFQESTVSGSVATMLSGWVTDSFLALVLSSPSLPSSGASQLAEVSLSNLNFINEYLRNETLGSAYTDCYSNGEGRRFGNDTFYLLDSAWLQRLNSRAWTYNITTTTTTTTTTTSSAPE